MIDVSVRESETEFKAETADDFLSRARGLSFRRSGKMLFLFRTDTSARIDMMFVQEPLYLYFMNSEKEIIDIQRAQPWGIDPRSWRLYHPSRPYRYLLESFEELDVDEGDRLDFED